MGKVAFVFPGQGSQVVGMGRAAYEASPAAREVFETADRVLGDSLSTLCFDGPEQALKLTTNTQPALLTVSIALFRAFGELPDVVAGHSLGEYSANVVAGSLSFEDAAPLVRLRGRYMQEAVPVGQGAMAAVLGGDLAAIERACREADGVAEPVNYNCPGQVVIAGTAAGIEAATPAITEAGGRVRLLPVSAPFHSSLMQPAEARMQAHLTEARFGEPLMPVYVNVDAVPVDQAAGLRSALMRQVSRPVRWHEMVQRMAADGVTLCVEIGSGRALSGMVRRIDRSLKFVSVEAPKDFDKARAAIAEARGTA